MQAHTTYFIASLASSSGWLETESMGCSTRIGNIVAIFSKDWKNPANA